VLGAWLPRQPMTAEAVDDPERTFWLSICCLVGAVSDGLVRRHAIVIANLMFSFMFFETH